MILCVAVRTNGELFSMLWLLLLFLPFMLFLFVFLKNLFVQYFCPTWLAWVVVIVGYSSWNPEDILFVIFHSFVSTFDQHKCFFCIWKIFISHFSISVLFFFVLILSFPSRFFSGNIFLWTHRPMCYQYVFSKWNCFVLSCDLLPYLQMLWI